MIPVLIGVIAALVLVSCLAVAAFVFRTPARVWLHSRYGLRIFGGSGSGGIGNNDRGYDTFVSYSVKDEDFVQQVRLQNSIQTTKLGPRLRDFNHSASSGPLRS